MGIFDGVPAAAATRVANYFKEGHYLWRIEAVREGKNRKGIPFFVVECKCVHVFDDANGLGHKEREEASWLILQNNDSFSGNVKRFVMAATGCEEEEVGVAECEALVSDAQPLAGVVIETQNVTVTTRAGNPFTKIGWKCAWTPEEVAEEVSPEIAAWLGLEIEE